MGAEKGRAFLLKIGSGGPGETFTTIAGLRSTSLTINAASVDITSKGSGGWRELLDGAGVRQVKLTAAGIFTNSAAELAMQGRALAGTIGNYQIVFESNDYFQGAFQVTSLEYAGEHNGERTYSIALDSSGSVSFTDV